MCQAHHETKGAAETTPLLLLSSIEAPVLFQVFIRIVVDLFTIALYIRRRNITGLIK